MGTLIGLLSSQRIGDTTSHLHSRKQKSWQEFTPCWRWMTWSASRSQTGNVSSPTSRASTGDSGMGGRLPRLLEARVRELEVRSGYLKSPWLLPSPKLQRNGESRSSRLWIRRWLIRKRIKRKKARKTRKKILMTK